MRIIFYKFAKKSNSLKKPTSGGVTLDCQLLENCSISTPSIIVANIDYKYSYCYIPDFGRYYFVHDAIIIAHGRYQYNLVVDVLASYRSEILSSSLYVKRSASNYNLFLPDDTWTHTTSFSESATSYSLPDYNAQGCYIVQIVSKEDTPTANPASTMYCMTPSNLALLLAHMFDEMNYSNIQDFDLTATYFNPFQYITSCRWYPFSVASMVDTSGTGNLVNVCYGWWETTIQARLVTTYGKSISRSIPLPTNNDWTDKDSNWSRLALFVPSCGLTEIDTSFAGQTLTAKMDIDYNTGKTFVKLTTGTNQICATLSGEIGAEVALNQISTNPNLPTSKEGLLGTALSIGGATLARNPKGVRKFVTNFGKMMLNSTPAGMLVGEILGTGNFAQNAVATVESGKEISSDVGDSILQTLLNPTVTSSGADGCRFTQLENHFFILYRRKYNHYNEAFSTLGGVCQRVLQLSVLSGYTVVANGMIDINGTQEEKNAICNLLEGGFYIE